MNYEKQYLRTKEVFQAIPLDGSISVLTGRNGSGKSLIRQQLSFRVKKQNNSELVHASMALRTGTHSHLGGLGVMLRDVEWSCTSINTLKCIRTALNSIREGYACLDEIEIGCGEETIIGLVQWLNGNLRESIKGSLGCLIITHSRHVVSNLDYDNWFNLDGYETAEEWLNRELIPTDMEQLNEDDLGFYRYIQSQKKT
jgi:energy-coupling factor transporter ATP-binding protein EcfA2